MRALLILVMAGILGGLDRADATAPDPATTMRDLARELDLQTGMPKVEPVPEMHWSLVHWHIPAGVAQWVLWGALAVGLGFALFAMRDIIPSVSRRTRPRLHDRADVLPIDQAAERMAEAGEDAEALARAGQFAEAMHLLLLRSLAELRQRLGVTIADSLTSREILSRLNLPDRGRSALADLIRRVEIVHFGREVAASGDYRACKANFDALVGAIRIADIGSSA